MSTVNPVIGNRIVIKRTNFIIFGVINVITNDRVQCITTVRNVIMGTVISTNYLTLTVVNGIVISNFGVIMTVNGVST